MESVLSFLGTTLIMVFILLIITIIIGLLIAKKLLKAGRKITADAVKMARPKIDDAKKQLTSKGRMEYQFEKQKYQTINNAIATLKNHSRINQMPTIYQNKL